MSRVIIFCGQSGSGKTTIAREVSNKLNMVCLHKDSIKERLYELQDGKTLEDSQRIGKQSILLLLALAEEMIRDGIDVMIESPFNHFDNLKRFQKWVDQYDVDIKIVICEIGEEERERRIATRPRHYSHHDVTRKLLGNFVKDTFDYSQMPGKKLLLDTARPLKDSLRKVSNFLEEK